MFEFLKKHSKKASKKLLAAALLVILQPMIAMGAELKSLWVGLLPDRDNHLHYQYSENLAQDIAGPDKVFDSTNGIDLYSAGALIMALHNLDRIQGDSI